MESEVNKFELYDNSKKLFKAKTYIQKDYIVLELESDSEKYLKKYNLVQLKNMSGYFLESNDLKTALRDLNDLFEFDYSIEEKEETINLDIKYTKSRRIVFILDKIKEKIDLSYDSLSDEMKEVINTNNLILGIDLGTTYSCASVMIDKNIVMIRNSLGSTTTPSYVFFHNKNEVYVGELAKLLPSNEKNILYNIKRLLGKNIEDKEIKKMQKLPFNLKKDNKFNLLKIGLNFGDKANDGEEEFYPEQICSLILKK